MIGIGNKGISDLRLGSKSVSAAYLGVNKVWPRDSSGITLFDYIQTDGACRIPLLNVKPAQDMVIVSSFYVASDPGNYRIFYGTENGIIQMLVNLLNQERRIISYGYESDGKRNISHWKSRPSEPTFYLLKHNFKGSQNFTAFYSNSGSPYLSSSLDAYQTSNPKTRFYYGYNDSTAFPSDQNLSIFGMANWSTDNYMVAGSRFYGMKIWSGGNLAHDLVAAKKASEYGIYDAVTQDFYANAGTGNLTGGKA